MLDSENQVTDEQLVLRAQAGDRDSFGELARRYEARLLRYVSKLIGGGDLEPADVVQETLIKAYLNLQGFDPERRFSPWIYRIAHNEMVSAVRRRTRDALDFYDFDNFLPQIRSKHNLESDADKQFLREQMGECLDKLSGAYREPLVLYAFEDMSYAEIGDVLHLSPAAVGVRINRAKSKLRQLCSTFKQ